MHKYLGLTIEIHPETYWTYKLRQILSNISSEQPNSKTLCGFVFHGPWLLSSGKASMYSCVSQDLQMQEVAILKELYAESAHSYWRFCRAKYSASCHLIYQSTQAETTQLDVHPM